MDISPSQVNEKYIYILRHSFIDGVIRIGSSEQCPDSIAQSLSKQINLPGEYQVFSAIKCSDAKQVTQQVLKSIAPYQAVKGFYELPAQTALNIIRRDSMRIPIKVHFNQGH
mgnify:CR=1 FL=1